MAPQDGDTYAVGEGLANGRDGRRAGLRVLRGQEVHADLLLEDLRFVDRVPLCRSVSHMCNGPERAETPTMSWTVANSLSVAMETAWTRNLSRHLKSRGGSCFIAWSNTAGWVSSGRLRPHQMHSGQLTCDRDAYGPARSGPSLA